MLDEKGRPIEIKPYERNAATDMIEEFMLMANETVAQHFYWQELPFIYRTSDIYSAFFNLSVARSASSARRSMREHSLATPGRIAL